ncbi:MAG TPA: primary-amine oxidase [Amycolatopsis sp.]|uniref:Amine oxidase n=1 Tax=Amycolatopsis nalaikhensis TaxID=715472 RepID=A0ABY8XII3_9PSEU|nr:primary-amine oxidase [Amycolatopsis sp. 2-2]WIV55443.1 primary-amine oxidase [Amycolatopsis sp. 2-2]
MTLTDDQVTTTATHPLDPVTAAEITAARGVLAEAGLLGDAVRFAFFALEEPAKDEVLAFTPGSPVERRFRVVLLDLADGSSRDVVVSTTRSTVDSVTGIDPAVSGQPPIIDTEFELVEDIVNGSETWCAALARRGIDPASVRSVPLSAGAYDEPGEAGRRIVRVLGFQQFHEKDHPWAHPVDGLVAYVDLTRREVVRVLDHRELPVPQEPGNFDDPAQTGPHRTTLKPIEITQPDGPSFAVDGSRVRWENWDLRLGFNEREGLTLHQLSFHERPVLYRASVAEMVVPYADPSPVRFWQNYFDCGEYMFARYTNSLELGCDCLGEIRYFDATVADDLGEPRTIGNAICMHEEDFGVLWKHSDMFAGSHETRRQRRLVISFFTTIGNYDYGFYWYLYLDGTIQLEAKATGITFTSAYTEGQDYATQLAPGLGAPYHQHLFSARLDMCVDGPRNAVDEVEAQRLPVSAENPYGNAFRESRTRLTSESEAARVADNSRARAWHIVNPESRNRLGRNVAYALYPEGQPTLLADESSSIHQRAAFATKHLWVTRYDPAERYPAGDLVNQHPGGAGLPAWTAADRSVDGEDIVLWHTFGLTHFPRPEDWPVMPVDYAGFTLKPVGFFDRNPTLDVPPSANGHCHGG